MTDADVPPDLNRQPTSLAHHKLSRPPNIELARSSPAATGIMVGMGVALTGLFLGIILPLKSADRSAVALVEHTQQVIVAVDQVALSADNIETGQRGFLLTQDIDYLKPYQQGIELIWHQYFTARELTTDNPRQQQNLQALADMLRDKMTELDRTVTLAHNGKIAEALDIVRTGEGQRLMNNIHRAIGDIITEEQRLLRQRRDQAAQLQQQSTLTLIILSVVAIGGFLTSGIMVGRMVTANPRIVTETAERRRLQDMANIAPVMLQAVDGTIRFWSEGCRRLYGWTAKQAIGRLSHDLLQTVFPVSSADVDATLLRHGTWNGELRQRASDGAELIVTASKTLHDYTDGTQRVVVETVTDVTALRQAQTELQQNQAQFNALVDAAADGFVIAGPDGRIELVNPALLDMFGYDRAEALIGQNLRVLTPVAEAQWHDDNIAAPQANALPRVIKVPSHDLRAVRRDGSEFPIDLSVSSFGTDDRRHITGIIRDVTIREQTEAALHNSAAQQRDLLLTLGLGTFMTREVDGTIRYWTEGCERLYGWTAEEAVGCSAHQLLSTVFPVPLSEVEATLEREGEWSGDLRHRTRDGRELIMTAHKRLRRGENGQRGIVMEALTDVTAYRRAEIALRDSEARLRLVQQVGGIAYSSRTLPEPEILISEEFARLYGLPSGQTRISQEDWVARLHPDDQARMLAERDGMLQSNHAFASDLRICRPDGTVRWVTLRMAVFSGADGEPSQVVGAQQDITDIVAAREALANRQQTLEARVAERTLALSAAESRFRGIFDSQAQFICLLAPNGTILEMNRSALDAAALAPGDIIGRPYWENHWWPAEQHDRLRQEIAAAGAGKQINREVEIRDARGKNVWIDFSLKPVHDPVTGAVIWIIAESRDQTEKHQLSAQLAQAQKMQALGQLAGGIAHDFNNILQAVSGAAMLIEQKPADLERTRRLAQATIAAARRGTSITQRLLSFARRGELRSSAVATADMLASMCEVLAHTLGSTIDVQTEVGWSVPSLVADQAQLETAIINLGTNARDAMPNGGTLILAADAEHVEEGQYHPAGLTPGDYVRLRVIDNGTGMSADVLARVSEPFFTTKPRGQGTGLGVAMAKGFAEQSGGGLSITSAPGEGTTVSMWLRQTVGDTPAIAYEDADTAHIAVETSARILLVDDDDLVRETLSNMLEDAGLATLVASSGLEAVALIEAGEIVDAMVSDLSMPGINGVTTIQRVRALRPQLPCFLLTGYIGERAALSAENTFTLVRKPVSGRALVAQIEAVLEAAR